MSLPDPLAAVCAYLRAQPEVQAEIDLTPAGLTGVPANIPAIFRPDLPIGIDEAMPLGCVAIRPAGGYTQFGSQTFRVADPRIDLTCFGESQQQATRIAQACATVLKQLTVPQAWENCWLYSATVHAGPVPLPDQQTLWPACWLSAVVVHGELPAIA